RAIISTAPSTPARSRRSSAFPISNNPCRPGLSTLDNTMLISTVRGMSDEPLIPYETTLFVRDTCLCLHAQRAARALARRFDDALRPLGLTNGQFSLLMALNRPEPPPMGPVATVLAMDRTTLTAALKPLERRGLVAVEADPRD